MIIGRFLMTLAIHANQKKNEILTTKSQLSEISSTKGLVWYSIKKKWDEMNEHNHQK